MEKQNDYAFVPQSYACQAPAQLTLQWWRLFYFSRKAASAFLHCQGAGGVAGVISCALADGQKPTRAGKAMQGVE